MRCYQPLSLDENIGLYLHTFHGMRPSARIDFDVELSDTIVLGDDFSRGRYFTIAAETDGVSHPREEHASLFRLY